MSLTRRLAAIGAPVLLASALTGCGFGGPPTDADPEAFCDAQTSFLEFAASAATGGEPPAASEAYDALQGQADEMEETGTPEDMPDDARTAWEDSIDNIRDTDEDDFTEDWESQDPEAFQDDDLEGEERDQAEALATYVQDTCGNPLEELAPQ